MTTAWTTKSFVDLLIKHHNDIDDKSPVFFIKYFTKLLFISHRRYLSRNGASLEEQNKFNVPKDRKTIKLWYERGLPCHRFSPIYTRIGFRVRNLLTGDFNTFCIDFDYLKLTRDLLEIIKNDDSYKNGSDRRIFELVCQTEADEITFDEFLMRAFLLTIRIHGNTGGSYA